MNTAFPFTTRIHRPFGKSGLLFVSSMVLSFALSQTAQAVTPPPDGGYPGGNTAEGQNALLNLTSGTYNTAVGWFSLGSNANSQFNTGLGAGTLFANTGDNNTAVGAGALLNNSTGGHNTANGAFALFSNTEGIDNTAIGDGALFANTADGNTAVGRSALSSNTSGSGNTADGALALAFNTTGDGNTGIGFNALLGNTTGTGNTAVGALALQENVGISNTATGFFALGSNTTGDSNTGMGFGALNDNTTGAFNTAIGSGALLSSTTAISNVAIGDSALLNDTTGSNNTAIGAAAGENLTTGDNNIDIGNPGVSGESNTIRIGTQGIQVAAYIAGVSGAPLESGVAVVVDATTGQLGVLPSSLRFKKDVKPMNAASEAILALKPVTFRYKREIDAVGTPQFGLVAEEVEKVNPDLVVRDTEGKPYTVRYDQVNAMLLNEFLKEHRKVERLKENFESKIAEQQKQIEVLCAGLRKVSAQFEASKMTPRVVLKDD
jgi:trimeric autotransporter adhesin